MSVHQREVPGTLYHYTSGSAVTAILESNEIWASSVHHLNDSREFAHAISLTRTRIQKFVSAHEGNEDQKRNCELIQFLSTRIEAVSSINIFVASFSTDGDSLSQWRAYCSDGPGFGLGFDVPTLEACARRQGFELRCCMYCHRDQVSMIDDLLLKFLDEAPEDTGSPPVDDLEVQQSVGIFLHRFVQLAPALKDHHFSDEVEWRFISKPMPTTDPRWRVRVGRSMLIPYVPLQFGAALKEIVVGPSPHQSLSADALSHCFNRDGFHGIGHSHVPYRDW